MTTAAEIIANADVDPDLGSQGQKKLPGDAGAPKLPVDPGNTPPPKVPTAEEKAKAVEAEAAAKVAADAAAAAKAKEAEAITEYITLEDPAGQAAINMLKEAGVSAQESNTFFSKAIDSGNLDDVDWAGLEKKVGADRAVLIKAGVTQYYNTGYKDAVATIDYGHKAVGGEENWNKVKDWAQAKEKTDPSFKTQVDGIRSAIKHNGYAAQIAIDRLKAMYEGDKTNNSLTFKMQSGDTTVLPLGDPLDRSEYVKLLKDAHDKGGKSLPNTIASLNARRQAGRARGL